MSEYENSEMKPGTYRVALTSRKVVSISSPQAWARVSGL